jgi:Cof subfamily protein (haloacid dehalogenase superfamily)
LSTNFKNIQLVATDLDGTFLKNDKTISQKNLEALNLLGDRNIIRVAATGRNIKKVQDVIDSDIPFDFVVFSSGAGVFDWRNQQHIYSQNITRQSVQKLLHFFISQKLNFHAFFPTPENHMHWYFRGEKPCEEFERYFSYNQSFAYELDVNNLPETEMCQFLLIIPENEEKYAILKSEIEQVCSEIRVIRASSPITKGYIWAEVFHHSVSKGNGIRHICEILGLDNQLTIGVGNDYNDFDLLEFTGYSFLTENSPEEIKHLYPIVPSNENDAFASAVQPIVE